MSNITNEFVENYIRDILPPSQDLFHKMEVYAVENNVPIVHKEVAALLRVLTMAVDAKRILEVGTAIAYSTLIFCDAMGENGHITTIERNEEMIIEAKKNISIANKESMIRLLPGEADEVLRFLDAQYDMIFLDGAKGQYNEFLNECINLLKPGGLLVSDNILYKGMIAHDDYAVRRKRTIVNRMRNYLDTICSHPMLETSIVPIGDGLAISYKKSRINEE
ncbi:O-methyltransferase [Alkaliphilus serpentinus]|uniref:tRNA 5-hydroxyuridine methyltransferase n=1 Tax=Alkaliphilus serpentinus TaxID=1482731 RepID=A0A833HN85_9FIRM|nr:O-methyltransferase [Alkaliphilus serpentinus]KAB3527612.1 O-methyltransferase [Alkaliphilus serpentinus]